MIRKERADIRRKTSDYFLVHDYESGELIGRIADLSTGGMKVITPEPLAAGRFFRLRISLPEPMEKAESLTVSTRCTWARENEKAGWHESGHTFLNLDSAAIAMIARITAKLMADESARLNRPNVKK